MFEYYQKINFPQFSFQVRHSTSITGSVRRLVGLLVCLSVTHSFDDQHVAPYWPTWPCFLNIDLLFSSFLETRFILLMNCYYHLLFIIFPRMCVLSYSLLLVCNLNVTKASIFPTRGQMDVHLIMIITIFEGNLDFLLILATDVGF